jgi:hypothetical protein
LNGHTSGVKARAAFETPLDPLAYVPNVGITDIEPYVIYVPELNAFIKVSGEFYTLVDEGYGTSDVSEDYALHYHQMEIKKPMVYNHAEKTFDVYTPVNRKATYLIHDPHKLIGWKSEWDGHALDIQVTYEAPDDWDDYKELRVLTGRDFSPEGMAVFQHNCSVVADKWNPSIFSMDPMTGVVTSGLVKYVPLSQPISSCCAIRTLSSHPCLPLFLQCSGYCQRFRYSPLRQTPYNSVRQAPLLRSRACRRPVRNCRG